MEAVNDRSAMTFLVLNIRVINCIKWQVIEIYGKKSTQENSSSSLGTLPPVSNNFSILRYSALLKYTLH